MTSYSIPCFPVLYIILIICMCSIYVFPIYTVLQHNNVSVQRLICSSMLDYILHYSMLFSCIINIIIHQHRRKQSLWRTCIDIESRRHRILVGLHLKFVLRNSGEHRALAQRTGKYRIPVYQLGQLYIAFEVSTYCMENSRKY